MTLVMVCGCFEVDPDGTGPGAVPPPDTTMDPVDEDPPPADAGMGSDPPPSAADAGDELSDASTASPPDASVAEPVDAGPPDAGADGEPPQVVMGAWPGNEPGPGGREGAFGGNLSGLTHQAATASDPERLWAVQNRPSMLFRLERDDDDDEWRSPWGEWRDGRQLHYPDGEGSPDAEGVTLAEGRAVYVASERDNDREQEGDRLSVLRFDPQASDGALTATHEWNLTDDLPEVESNQGIEAITWVPDAHLTLHDFKDEARGERYDPAHYPGHGSGLFFVGLEANGWVYAYALNHDDGSAVRVASLSSGQDQVMGLEFDVQQGSLWAHCDNGCQNRTSLLTLHGGRFVVRALLDAPASLVELNNEGIALAPCVDGTRTFFWADDNETDGQSIRTGQIPCTIPFAP